MKQRETTVSFQESTWKEMVTVTIFQYFHLVFMHMLKRLMEKIEERRKYQQGLDSCQN